MSAVAELLPGSLLLLHGLGMGLLGDPQAQVLEPTALLAVPLGVPAGLGVTASLRLFLAFLFTFSLARRLGIGEAGAALAAFAFGFGGYLSLWLGWPLSAVATWLPAVLYGSLVAMKRGAPRDFLLLAGATASLLMAGHPETILYALALAGVFAAASAFRERPPLGQVVRTGLAAVLGALLVAPAWLAMADLLPGTVRQDVLAHRNGLLAEGHEVPPRNLAAIFVPMLMPRYFGADTDGSLRIVPVGDRPGSGFPGTLAWVLAAGLALSAPGRWRPIERFWLLAAAGLVVLLAKPPESARWFVDMPGLSALPLVWSRLSLPLNLALALLAGLALDRLPNDPVTARRTRWLAGLAAGSLAALALLAADPRSAVGLSLGGQALVAAAAVWALGARGGAPRPAVVVVVTAVELAAHFGGDFSRRAPAFAHAEPPLAHALRRWTAAVPAPVRVAGLEGATGPNRLAQLGFDELGVSGPVRPWKTAELTKAINSGARQTADSFIRPEDPLYRWLGVRFLVTAPGVKLGEPYRLRHRGRRGRIYERTDALPLVFGVDPDPGDKLPRGGAPAVGLPATRLEPEHWRADVPAEAPGFVASSIFDDGHWHRLLDGERIPPVTLEGTLVAVPHPGRACRVDFLYRPRPVVLGAASSALALVLLGALTLRRP